MEKIITETHLPVLPFEGWNKTRISEEAKEIVARVSEVGGALQVAEALSAMENLIKEIKARPEYVEAVRLDLERHGGKATTNSGAKLEACETGTKYHYDKCEDVRLNDLYAERTALDEKVKRREAELRLLPPEGDEFLDTETGNVWRAYPPYKTSTSSFKVTLSK